MWHVLKSLCVDQGLCCYGPHNIKMNWRVILFDTGICCLQGWILLWEWWDCSSFHILPKNHSLSWDRKNGRGRSRVFLPVLQFISAEHSSSDGIRFSSLWLWVLLQKGVLPLHLLVWIQPSYEVKWGTMFLNDNVLLCLISSGLPWKSMCWIRDLNWFWWQWGKEEAINFCPLQSETRNWCQSRRYLHGNRRWVVNF